METDIATAFNDLNPREHYGLGMPWVEGKLCGSSKLVGDAAFPGVHTSRSQWYSGEGTHWGGGGLHRG